MSAKDARRVKKRKERLAARKERERYQELTTPYSGRKYRAPRWVSHVYHTELAILETIGLSQQRLTNEQVRQALVQLINLLRSGTPPALSSDEAEPEFEPGNEVDFLVSNIRGHWRRLFGDERPTGAADLIGILRRLLYSIEAHNWNTGSQRGYVEYLPQFMAGTPAPTEEEAIQRVIDTYEQQMESADQRM